MPSPSPFTVAGNFRFPGEILSATRFGSGKINDTFLVVTREGKFILQRLNPVVFLQPELVMHNLRTIEAHITGRIRADVSLRDRRWEVPAVISTRSGRDLFQDEEGKSWRAITFIDHAEAYETLRNPSHAQQSGWALGRFHRLLHDLPVEKLHDTLPGFHVTPGYLKRLEAAAAGPRQRARAGKKVADCLDFVARRKNVAGVLEDALKRGEIQRQVVHGDPKVSNILMDSSTAEAIGLVDLDTVKPGLIHYDIGDCLRSCCNPVGEEAETAEVYFDPEICRLVLQGYLKEAANFVSTAGLNFFYDAIRLIPLELGIRFLTDHLEGDTYFKIDHPGQNLERALVQFHLCRSIEEQEGEIRAIIAGIPACG
jgi:Ser/Thr protein kinase RdoA (MazF antagonist)